MSTEKALAKDPFSILLDIERKCKENGQPLPRQHDLARTWQGIGFISANQHFVAPLSEIKEVLIVPKVTKLPAGADWFMGFANLRGHLLPVTDLENFVCGTPQSISELSRIVVINFEQTGVGFLVQRVLGVQRFSTTALKTRETPKTKETATIKETQNTKETTKTKATSSTKEMASSKTTQTDISTTDIDPKFIPYLQGEFSDELVKWHVLSLQSLSQMSQFYHVVKESEG